MRSPIRSSLPDFAHLVTSFVHLEDQMATVLAVLLGAVDANPARYVMRTIRSPTGRIDVLRALLEECQNNANRDQFYDDVIAEFASINKQRNGFVHGQWWTHCDGRTFLVEFMDDLRLMNSREVSTTELDAVTERIGALLLKTSIVPQQHLREHLLQLEQLFAQSGEPKPP